LIKEPKTKAGPKTLISNKELYLDTINKIFLDLELAYHYQFYKVFSNENKINSAKKLWAENLQQYEIQQILNASKIMIAKHEFLPTLHDFLKLCNEAPINLNLPSSEAAFAEACSSFSPRKLFPWSHSIVYFAGKKIGWSNLNLSNSASKAQFIRIYKKLQLELNNGIEFSIPNSDEEEKQKETDPKLLEKLRKKHNI